MAGLTKNELAEMVKDLRGQYKELAGMHISLQEKHLKLQIEYGQSLRQRVNKLEGLSGKNGKSLPKRKESLVLTPEVNIRKEGVSRGV